MIRGSGVLPALILTAAAAQAEVSKWPTLWGHTTCGALAGSDAVLLEEVVEAVEERLAMATWEASLADARQQRYLEAVARMAAEDLVGIVSALPALSHLAGEPEPSPAELYGLVGDLLLITDRPRRAMAAYRHALEAAPGKATYCTASYDGKIYSFEIVHRITPRSQSRLLTPYMLARDPETGQVLERFLLPSAPVYFSIGRNGLDIVYHHRYPLEEARSIHFARQELDYPVWVPDDLFSRSRLRYGSLGLADNLITRDNGEPGPELAPRRYLIEYLAADLDALEATLRQAVSLDPTQPWHLFVLGQCLWAQGRRTDAVATWEDLLAGEFPTIPYYEYTRMAWYFELYRQPEWADAAFREALARRRGLPLPVTRGSLVERRANVSTRRLLPEDLWPELDAERAYLWWLRMREISGVSAGDDFRAVLWANYFKSTGDAERSAAELAYLDRVQRSWPWPSPAGLDYALWFVAAAGGLLAVYLVLSIKNLLWWIFKARITRAVIFFIASLLTGELLFSLPELSPAWYFLALSCLSLALLGFFSFLPLILSVLRFFRPSLSGVERRRTLVAGLHRCSVELIPFLVFGVSLAALSFTTSHATRFYAASLDLSDVLERQPSVTEDADAELRLGAALASHRSGDFQRARQLYETLPVTPQVRLNLSALAGELPPLVSELVPYAPRIDLPTLVREWIREESWRPWRLPYKALYLGLQPQIVGLVEAYSAPAQYFFATNAYARIALLASPLALLLALFLRPLRRGLGRALLILIPGAIYLWRGQVLRGYLVLWLFFFSAGPLCWLFLARTSDPDFVDAFGPHPSLGVFSSYSSSIPEDDFALPPPRYDQLLAENFWPLLWLYPGARLFYFLVALCLFAALGLHGRQIPGILGLAQGDRQAADTSSSAPRNSSPRLDFLGPAPPL